MNKNLVVVVAVVTVLVVGVGGGLVAALVAGSSNDGSSGSSDAPPRGERAPVEPAGPVPEGLEAYYSQQLDWEECGSIECTTLEVPVDYQEPDGETVRVNVKRARALDEGNRVGSLVVNPGGPGAPGSTMAENAEGYFRDQLRERVDVVAFDPRGTGESDPVDCLSDEDLDEFVAQDPAPDDAAEGQEVVANQDAFFAGCLAGSDDLVGHVSTVETARDMDVLRSVLGEEKLSYLGFSYGTTLGSTYASLFPANVGRFVLDGATDPTLDFRDNALSQAAGFQTALNAYVDDCVEKGDCFLGSDRSAALATIDGLLDDIDKAPLPTGGDRELQIGNAFYGIVTPLYGRENWPLLDRGLQEALDGKGDTLLLLSDLYGSRSAGGGYEDNSLEAILAINCLDDPESIEAAEVPAEFPAFDKASPTFGRVFAWGLTGCHGIQVEAAEKPPVIKAEGAAPIVVVGTTRDPATPYEEAVALAEQLDSGLLLTRDGDGHTAYNKGNDCIDEAIEGYLLEGEAPEDDTRC